jgi:hypothetical protein
MIPRIPKPLLAFTCVALLFSAVVVPLFQLNGSLPGSALWTIAPLAVSGVAVAAVVVWPWVKARPVRVVLASHVKENPSSLVFPAGMNNGDTAVVIADARGLGIVSHVGATSWLSWDEIEKVVREETDKWPHERIGIDMKTGSESFAFVPLRRDAVHPIRPRELWGLVARLIATDQTSQE